MLSSLRILVRDIYASTRHLCRSVFSLAPAEQKAVLWIVVLFTLGCLVRLFHWWGITE